MTTVDKGIYLITAVLAIGALLWLGTWIIQTALGYFGLEFTMWQVFIIWWAALLLQTKTTVNNS